MKISLDIGDVELKEVVQCFTDYEPPASGSGNFQRVAKKRYSWALITDDPRLLGHILYHLGLGELYSHVAGKRLYVTGRDAGERILRTLEKLVSTKEVQAR
ncbi:MAG: hypothetical protein JRN21_09360 [Nitrososphaerota archaeon]|nr:hypothetical protein [Nitrososphaerota archaeon]